MLLFMALAWALSTDRRAMPWRLAGVAVLTQIVVGAILFHLELGRTLFATLNQAVTALLEPAREGATFVFGALSLPPEAEGSLGFILAFQALPTAIFFAALTALLYYFGILQWVVRGFALFFQRSLGITGVEATSAASNLFVGIESMLTVRPYLAQAKPHEIAVVLAAGMATIASTVLGLYVGILQPVFPDIAGHLLTANLLSAPAAVLMARILVPAPRKIDVLGSAHTDEMPTSPIQTVRPGSAIEAITQGANEGLKLAFGITAVLIAFVGLLALANSILGAVGGWVGKPDITLESLLAWIFLPFAWLMGITASDAFQAAELLALRLVATEVPAYFALATGIQQNTWSDPRSVVIMAYALCGFAHLPSLGIFAGGLCALVPEQKTVIGQLAWRALLAATLACLMTGAMAGILCAGSGLELS